MKKCQIGTRNYQEANDLHAECYGTIGSLITIIETIRSHLVETSKFGEDPDDVETESLIRDLDQLLR